MSELTDGIVWAQHEKNKTTYFMVDFNTHFSTPTEPNSFDNRAVGECICTLIITTINHHVQT